MFSSLTGSETATRTGTRPAPCTSWPRRRRKRKLFRYAKYNNKKCPYYIIQIWKGYNGITLPYLSSISYKSADHHEIDSVSFWHHLYLFSVAEALCINTVIIHCSPWQFLNMHKHLKLDQQLYPCWSVQSGCTDMFWPIWKLYQPEDLFKDKIACSKLSRIATDIQGLLWMITFTGELLTTRNSYEWCHRYFALISELLVH